MLKYDEASPSCLVWAIARGGAKVGETAGSLDSNGYWRIGSKSNRILAHIHIWKMFNGEIPEGFNVDHKDGNRSNNKLSNLRLVPYVLNYRNLSMYNNNTSGTTGVTVRFKKGIKSFVAFWRTNRLNTRSFSCNKYGEELAEFLAQECRGIQIQKLNVLGFGYTERHGINKLRGIQHEA